MKETGKRIVSKGMYARLQGKRIVIIISSGCLLLIAGCFCTASLLMFCRFVKGIMNGMSDPDGTGYPSFSLLWSEAGETPIVVWSFYLVLSLGFSAATYYSFRYALREITRAKSIDPGLPLTRANIGDLPAPDSLVRASEEPVKEPQVVLLRAATNSEQTPMEQLVRPANGGRDQP